MSVEQESEPMSRKARARVSHQAELFGGPQLILAKLIVRLEKTVQAFALPLMLAGFFVALAWLGAFTSLYPWAHLAALIVFVVFFFDALGKARVVYRAATPGEAKRRLETASGLRHRPLDVLEDRPIGSDDEQLQLWRTHTERAKEQLQKRRWPGWALSFTDRDPYAIRYALILLLCLGGFCSWGVWGGRLIAAINPALGKQLSVFSPTLDAWITPPEYTGLPPIMIATPAGARHDGDVVDVPAGSFITAHLAGHDGDTPELTVNNEKMLFKASDKDDFEISSVITSGETIAIHRGWQNLGSWHVRVVPDQPPQIAFTEPPSATERKTTRIVYTASDDYGVTTVSVKITPKQSLPGADNNPVTIVLATPNSKDIKRESFLDLTPHPWAGLPVAIQLFATDAVGHVAESASADFILPERTFMNPIARALIDERRKLLQNPSDDNLHNEIANTMASIARQPSDYRGDPAVLLALRSGAVRLVLNRTPEIAEPVSNILWQSAVRIEDGTVGVAQDNLRQAQKDLADALDRNASQEEIERLIDRLHQALAQYLQQLATQLAQQPAQSSELQQVLGKQMNMITPQDLGRMLEQLRTLSATGSRDEARQELSKLQQLLENMSSAPPQLSAEQKMDLQKLETLRDITQKQQELLDQTFRNAQNDNDVQENHKILGQQAALLQQLQELMGKGQSVKPAENLQQGAQSMQAAEEALGQNTARRAAQHQNEALQALQKGMQEMADSLQAEMMMLPGAGAMGMKYDPLGRTTGLAPDDEGVKVPDQMEVQRVREILNELQRRAGDGARSKTERDYIDRLLQNF